MPRCRAKGQNLEHLKKKILVWNYSYLNNRYYLGLTLSMNFRPRGFSALGWGKGSKSRNFFFLYFSFMESFVIVQKVLYCSTKVKHG